EKNIDFLFRMFARVVAERPDAVMIVAGEGPALAHCKSYVRSLGVAEQVRFVGYLSRESALLDCYRCGDLFVFSSKTETQGLVLLEAMALGVPVVSTAHMGTAEIVSPQRGAAVAPDDEAQFAQIVLSLLSSPERRTSMSAAARAFAASWSATAMADRLARLYSGAVAQARRNRPLSQPV
ncbi:MAG: glycosyltransferase, partial [Steroidobacteraceae bacterium]